MFTLGRFVILSALTTKPKIEETGISFTVIRDKKIYFCICCFSVTEKCAIYLSIGSSSNISESVLMDLMNNNYS